MKNVHKIFYIAVVFLYSCSNDTAKKITVQKQSFNNKQVAVKSEMVKFELDSLTSPMINCIQHYNTGENETLIYLNEESGVLYVNDVKTKKILKKIEVKDNLPHHKKNFQGFYYHNKDSIFMIDYKPKVTLINEAGKVLQEYLLNSDNSSKEFSKYFLKGVWVSTSLQPYFYNNILYLGSVVVGGAKTEKKKIQIQLNTATKKVNGGNVIFPDIYSKYSFGDNNYEIYSVCANTKTQTLVYAFPQDENVIINGLKSNSILMKSAQSKYITDFTEYDEKIYKKLSSANPTLEYFMTTASYEGIYYDKYRDLYYRLALLPVEEKGANYDKKDAPIKQMSIVVFDKDFNYLGEKLLEKNKHLMFSAFVSAKGLNVQNKTKQDETFDFTTYSFTF